MPHLTSADMAQPQFLDFDTAASVCTDASLASLLQRAAGGQLVLRIGALSAAESSGLIERLAHALPDHAVFQSRFAPDSGWITLLPLVSAAQIHAHRDQIRTAIAAYVSACTELVAQYQAGTLPQVWSADEHGEHCQFAHASTGQVVEAPLFQLEQVAQIDPGFFALFVKTSPAHASVAALLKHDFHDADRILKTMAAEMPEIYPST